MRALAQRFVRPSLRSARPMSTLVIAEHAEGALRPHTYATITAASQLPGEITVLVTGEGCASAAQAAANAAGVTRVVSVDSPACAKPIAESVAAVICAAVKGAAESGSAFTHVLAAASNLGKNAIPRAAALLDSAPVSDVIEIKDAQTFVRPTCEERRLREARRRLVDSPSAASHFCARARALPGTRATRSRP